MNPLQVVVEVSDFLILWSPVSLFTNEFCLLRVLLASLVLLAELDLPALL